MDQASAHDERPSGATPLFGAYRRGYDPEQVDRYVADQQRRLDETTHRASEAERKLAAAVGQLRELHRRVAALESEDRSPHAPPLDSLGERVQRILQEAWEGAYALRQSTEQEMAELRERTAGEAEATVMTARQRARAIEEEIDRRRTAYIEQLDAEKNKAAAQIAQIHRERDIAIGELLKVKAIIETTVSDISRGEPIELEVDEETVATEAAEEPVVERPMARVVSRRQQPRLRAARAGESLAMVSSPREQEQSSADAPNPSELVRNHRAMQAPLAARAAGSRRAPLDSTQASAKVFDFDDSDDI
jgi:hypothetical protein